MAMRSKQRRTPCCIEIMRNHFGAHLAGAHLRRPSELTLRFAWIAEQ
jgi:hypothetical protein